MTDILDLPFDQYQRYELVHAVLESVRGEGQRFHVLDVGGRTALLRDFLPDDRVDLVDIDPSDAEGLVLGSGAELPFQDDSFDAVCCFDTLEHVPPALRDSFVAECARVAKNYVIIAGPYDAPRVAEAEEILLDFLKVRLDWEHRYLAEHRANGLPDMVATQRGLETAGAVTAVIGHGSLDLWLLLMSLELYIEHEELLGDFARRVYRFYNEHLFLSDHGPEVYRHAVIGAFGGAPMPSLDGVLEPPGSAPAEAGRTLIDMGREILRYDALRDTYRPEMDRLHGVVSDLTKDLEEHGASLAAAREDLSGHRASLETLRNDSRAHAEGLEAQAEELRADLVEQRKVLAEVEVLRAAERAEMESRGEQLAAANEQLVDQNAQLERVQMSLHQALRRIESKEEIEASLRGAMAQAVATAVDGSAREKALEGASFTLDEQVALMITARNRRLQERDDAREAHAAERARSAALAREAKRLWNRIGRALMFRRLDPGLIDPGLIEDE